jgi:radical SAM protein with 4Fe4S-binding SPASM domain
MMYRQKFDTFIRIYDDVGYIINCSDYGDRVTDKSGSIFLRALARKPQTLNELVSKILCEYINANPAIVEKDAIEFYKLLEDDGFIVSGETEDELNKKDIRFSYDELNPKTIKNDFTPNKFRADKNSQDYLINHFKYNPHLMQFQVELTSRCNERCIHCYIPHKNKINDITQKLFYSTLDQCRDMGILNLTLSGGEPMMHPDFVVFLQKAKEYDFSINILSNLTLLNDKIINEMKANRLSSIQTSLYSMNPETHDSITNVNGSFYKTRDAILELIKNDIPLQISCPVMKQNKTSYIDVMNWASSHKLRVITDYIMMARYDHTTSNLDNRLNVKEIEYIMKTIIKNDMDYQKRLRKADFTEIDQNNIGDDTLCGVCISSICMGANGDLYPCAGWQNFIIGNICEKPLKEIWDNSPRVQYLRNLRKKDLPKCIRCKDRNFCAICLARNANENNEFSQVGTLGDPLKPNEHFCKIAEVNHKIVLKWKAGDKSKRKNQVFF